MFYNSTAFCGETQNIICKFTAQLNLMQPKNSNNILTVSEALRHISCSLRLLLTCLHDTSVTVLSVVHICTFAFVLVQPSAVSLT